MTDYGEGQYFDEGYGGESAGGDFSDVTFPDWMAQAEWLEFANNMVEAVQHHPEAVQDWYGEYAKARELRGLAEAAAEAEEVSAKLGENPTEFNRQVIAAMKAAKERAAS